MLKCKIKKGHGINVKATGTAEELMLETAMVVQQVFRSIREQNPEAAKGYKLKLLGLLLDPASPVWKEV